MTGPSTAPEATGQEGRARVLLAVPDALRAMADNAEAAIVACEAGRVARLEEELRQRRHEAERADDLIRELRRQRVYLERQADRGNEAIKKVRAVERVRVWTNEDRKRFMFADDIRDALGIPS